jgi:hypothetical protein
MILLKNPMNASTGLSMNGKSPMILTAPLFVLSSRRFKRRVFQQNQNNGISRLFHWHRVFAVEGRIKNHKGSGGFAGGINKVVHGVTGDINDIAH